MVRPPGPTIGRLDQAALIGPFDSQERCGNTVLLGDHVYVQIEMIATPGAERRQLEASSALISGGQTQEQGVTSLPAKFGAPGLVVQPSQNPLGYLNIQKRNVNPMPQPSGPGGIHRNGGHALATIER